MKIALNIPDVDQFGRGFDEYWLRLMLGSFSDSYATNALTANYLRLVEAALQEYRLAKVEVNEFWSRHDSIPLGAMHRAIAHYESCIVDMHRAILCFKRLRKSPSVPLDLRSILQNENRTLRTDTTNKLLKDIRDAIQHLEEKVLNGDIPAGTPFMLNPTGPETPIPAEPSQTLKTIDRLTIGNLEVEFEQLARWLAELGSCARTISRYRGGTASPTVAERV